MSGGNGSTPDTGINHVAVLGAGVMGAGIAAHVANAGVKVTLLDIVPEGANDRNSVAAGAVQKLLKANPAAFMHKRNAKLVSVGNLEDDMGKLADADWIVEAVIERVDIKRDLYKRVDEARKPGSIVSSNTSTIPLHDLVEGASDAFKRDFLITHFFNPPRYMRLLELVTGPHTRPDAVASVRAFGDIALGKGVVDCNDTPGFIGNRIGIYWLQVAVAEAFSRGVTVEEADALIARPMGIPKTGVFGLVDLVGLDLMPHVVKSMESTLAKGDAFFDYIEIPELVQKMIADGYTGRKGKGGFYRLNKGADGARVKESISLKTGEYAKSVKPRLAALAASKAAGRKDGLRTLVSYEDPMGEYAFAVLAKTLHYAASLVPEIADDIVSVDEAMRLGYNWDFGPFELIDSLGAEWFAGALEAKGMSVPALVKQAAEAGGFYRVNKDHREYLTVEGGYAPLERSEGVLLLSDVKLGAKPVAKNGSASLWDLGDGIACLEVHTKMNAIDPEVMKMIHRTLTIVPKKFKGLVVHNGAENFSVGVNLGLALYAANMAAWGEIEGLVKLGQDTYKALKYAPFPVVGAPSGMALGGGCEILLHCDAVVAHAETYMGLVEVGVGLIPGWGGCKEMLQRWTANKKRPGGPMPPVGKAFETISMAAVSKSAAEARDHLFLRPHDRIVMNRDRVLAEAKAMALEMSTDYTAPESPEITLPGPSAHAAMCMAVEGFHKQGKATDYDVVVSEGLAEVLSGGDTDVTETVTEDGLLALERKAFMGLIRRDGSLSRMEHMLETGKPLELILHIAPSVQCASSSMFAPAVNC